MSAELPDASAAAREYARDLVRSGFETRDAIVQSVTECLEEYELQDLERLVETSVDSEIRALREEQESWGSPTDCERLDEAFEQLKASGILAQHHYTCCGTCGNFEIGVHLDFESSQGRVWRGYAFYHVQDTESAIHGYGQCLSYGSANQEDAASVSIGREIVQVLESHGFATRWDGTIQKRIAFEMEWQRPWPPRRPDVVPQAALDRYQSLKQSRDRESAKGVFAKVRRLLRR